MKSEQQNIQESNLLADQIENFLIKTKKVLPQIISVVVLALVGLLGFGIYQSIRNSQSAEGWTALYFSDTDASDLESIADDFGTTPAGLWARQSAGDAHLAKALESVFTNRDVADQHYKNAVAEYAKVIDKGSDPLLLARTHFGMAQAHEGLANRDEAISSYRKIASLAVADPTFQAEATKRADWLESKDGESFLTWFKENRQSAPAIAPPTSDRPAIPGQPTLDFQPQTGNPGLPNASSEATNPEAKPAGDKPADPATTEAPAAAENSSAPAVETPPQGDSSPKSEAPKD
ncbi:hypothetical protein SH501x_000615 [Pirellulaceae bacterium SH501]